jgi:hypothetical protein
MDDKMEGLIADSPEPFLRAADVVSEPVRGGGGLVRKAAPEVIRDKAAEIPSQGQDELAVEKGPRRVAMKADDRRPLALIKVVQLAIAAGKPAGRKRI